MKKNYSIHLYKPEKNICKIPFHIVIQPNHDHIGDSLMNPNTKTFSTSKFDTFLLDNNINPQDFYKKELVINLVATNKKNEPFNLAFIIVDFINLKLLKSSKVSPAVLLNNDEDSFDSFIHSIMCEDSPSIDSKFLGFDNENIVYLHSLYVYPEFRGQGLANYLISSTPDILSLTSALNFKMIVAPLEVFFMPSEKDSLKDDFQIKQYMHSEAKKATNLLKNQGFKELLMDEEGRVMFSKMVNY